MKIYCVGGAVRDELLGLPVKDRDYVVVGATPEEMAKQGYKPVGRDFPVFLHPETHEEHALARTERKTARGYHGFEFHAAPDVTLEQDLARRDLTINAIARDADGRIFDPHNGAADLKAGVLRHVSPAFAEDPVRILRVARFAARFGFAIAPETEALMRRMVRAGEADALVPERVWQELARGLMERSPSRMVMVLRECGALARVLPQLDEWYSDSVSPERFASRLDEAAARGYALPVRYALLVLELVPDAAAALAQRVNAPGDCRELAVAANRERELLLQPCSDAESTLGLLDRCDAFRRPERLDRLLEVAHCDAHSHASDRCVPEVELRRALEAARGIDSGVIAREHPDDIPGAIRRARLTAIAGLQPPTGH